MARSLHLLPVRALEETARSFLGGLLVMSKSSLRIVLVDPLGDVLFSGESMMASFANDLEEEPVPTTRRSATSESGIFASVPSRGGANHEAPESPDEIRSVRPRAA